MGRHTGTLEEVAVVSANTSVLFDIGHPDQVLMNLVCLYHTDHMQLVSASCGDDGAYLVAPCDQSVSNIVGGIVVMVVGSPFAVVDGVVVACAHTVGAAYHLVGCCRNCACTELAVVGVAAAEGGGADVACWVEQHVAWGAAAVDTWEIGG